MNSGLQPPLCNALISAWVTGDPLRLLICTLRLEIYLLCEASDNADHRPAFIEGAGQLEECLLLPQVPYL